MDIREALERDRNAVLSTRRRRDKLILALRDAGLTLEEIGEAVGLSRQGVHRILHRERERGEGTSGSAQ